MTSLSGASVFLAAAIKGVSQQSSERQSERQLEKVWCVQQDK